MLRLKPTFNVKMFVSQAAERLLMQLNEGRLERIDLTRLVFTSPTEADSFFYHLCRLL